MTVSPASRFHSTRASKTAIVAATTTLPTGESYEFRYLVDGQTWLTDQEADGVVMSPFGEPNAVLQL